MSALEQLIRGGRTHWRPLCHRGRPAVPGHCGGSERGAGWDRREPATGGRAWGNGREQQQQQQWQSR